MYLFGSVWDGEGMKDGGIRFYIGLLILNNIQYSELPVR